MSPNLGAWLRQQRQARGWNVPEMARQLRQAAKASGDKLPANEALFTYIRRWERGEVAPSERYKLPYCKAFGIPPSGFGRSGDDSSSAQVEVWPGQGCAEHDYIEDVRRNEFLTLTGATLVSFLGPPLVHGWADRQPPQLPDLSDTLLAQLRAQTEGFRWLDRQRGARDLLPVTTTYARNLAGFWRLTERAHPLRADLAQVAADACHLVAYQALDQGNRSQAIEWYRSSAELAAQASDKDLYVFAMCGVAYVHARNATSWLFRCYTS